MLFKIHVNASRGKKNVDCSCNARNSFSVSLMLGENKNNFWLDVYLGDITSVLRIFASLFPTVKHHTTSPCRAWSKERFYCCISRILMHNLIHVACELHRELYQPLLGSPRASSWSINRIWGGWSVEKRNYKPIKSFQWKLIDGEYGGWLLTGDQSMLPGVCVPDGNVKQAGM